jgi:cation:H+ antiporter
MIGSAAALIIMSLDGVLTQTEGGLLLLAAVFYTALLVRESRRESSAMKREFAQEFALKEVTADSRGLRFAWQSAFLVAGIALTVLGADLLVAGAVNIAETCDVSEAFIGLTLVAIGTSAPELATTLVSTIKNDRDVAIGNLIGSSIYSILVILGLTMLASPGGVEVGRDFAQLTSRNGTSVSEARDKETASCGPYGSRWLSACRRTPRRRAARGALQAAARASGCRSACGTDRATRNR